MVPIFHLETFHKRFFCGTRNNIYCSKRYKLARLISIVNTIETWISFSICSCTARSHIAKLSKLFAATSTECPETDQLPADALPRSVGNVNSEISRCLEIENTTNVHWTEQRRLGAAKRGASCNAQHLQHFQESWI